MVIKAFDSVPREMLWRLVEERYRVAGRLKKVIKSLYDPCMCSVRAMAWSERWFRVKLGVKDGSVLSLLLFIPYMNDVGTDFKQDREENYIGQLLMRTT